LWNLAASADGMCTRKDHNTPSIALVEVLVVVASARLDN